MVRYVVKAEENVLFLFVIKSRKFIYCGASVKYIIHILHGNFC